MIDSTQILAGINTRLTTDANLIAVVPAANIKVHLPQDNVFPHIMWELTESSLEVKGENAIDMELTLNIWSDNRSIKQLYEIRDLLMDALADQPIVIASGDGFGCTFSSFDSLQDDDGLTYQGIMVFSLKFGE